MPSSLLGVVMGRKTEEEAAFCGLFAEYWI